MSDANAGESRDGVPLTNLDQPLFDGAGATKRDLVEYLDAVRDRIIPVLEDRPLSVIRVHRGQEAFMQKNVPKYTPSWVRTVDVWAEASHRERLVRALQRPPHAALVREPARDRVPPVARPRRSPRPRDPSRSRSRPARGRRVRGGRPRRAARARTRSATLGLEGAVKTSGAKGVHVFVPIDDARLDGGRGRRDACRSRRGPRRWIPTSRRRRS